MAWKRVGLWLLLEEQFSQQTFTEWNSRNPQLSHNHLTHLLSTGEGGGEGGGDKKLGGENFIKNERRELGA